MNLKSTELIYTSMEKSEIENKILLPVVENKTEKVKAIYLHGKRVNESKILQENDVLKKIKEKLENEN